MQRLAEVCEAIGGTTKKLEKILRLAEYFKARSAEEGAVSAVFLSGRAFPAWEETTLKVSGTLLWKTVAELSGRDAAEMTAAYRRHGDLGAVAGEVLAGAGAGLDVVEVEAVLRQIAEARGPAAKTALVRKLLRRSSPVEAKYIIKIMTGDLRIGLKESLVEEAIAKAYGGELVAVQRANMLLGDIGETLRMAASGILAEARMRMFHALGFMLATPAESAEEAFEYFSDAAVEDKYDGIRAQAHVADGEVKLFSRTRDEITESFPELPGALAGLSQDAILDGEIVAWEHAAPQGSKPASAAPSEGTIEVASLPAKDGESSDGLQIDAIQGRARPFSELQKRIGRKKVSAELLRQVPVAYVAFDVLYAAGELLIDRPLRERGEILDGLLGREGKIFRPGGRVAPSNPGEQGKLTFAMEDPMPGQRVIRAPVFRAASPGQLDELFAAAQARGNEGLMIKDLNSLYTPGKRGKSWLKMKRELATLDVVVTAVEYGHGRRVKVLSDYTFAVRDGDRLLNIGKAYSGLTDLEIAEMTQWFLEHTVEDQGFRRTVEPKIVVEVAFNNMMRSERHESGYALRFPRIMRLRPDKSAEEADTLERAKEIFERQGSVPLSSENREPRTEN